MTEQQDSAPLLKEIFNRVRFEQIAAEASAVSPEFDASRFLAKATDDLHALGIMQRMRQGAEALHAALPVPYPKAIEVLDRLAPRIGHNFAAIMLSEFVALYGRDDFDLSLNALKCYTRFGSSEFAIRHFLKDDLKRTLAAMRGWAEDENEHVRRLASEGSRPRLPWSFQLKPVMENPALTWPILDALKADESLYVRKSVANHLNDIAKDHPDWLLARLESWPRDNSHTSWIVRHVAKADVRVAAFSVAPDKVQLGGHVVIEAEIVSTAKKSQRLVTDYAVHYVKANGGTSRKVFKLREFDLEPGASQVLSIKRAIRDFTTRKHYAGQHGVELIVNGETVAEGRFELVV